MHSRFGEIEGLALRMHAGRMKVTPSVPNAYYAPPPGEPVARARADLDPGLVWRDTATPASARFGDDYFSGVGGLAGARHTFLQGTGLPEAWARRRCFVIGETGFGSGLNFLATWKAWRQSAPPGAILHYLAVEGFPLTPRQILACLSPWPELAPLAAELAAVYPPPHDGFHRVWLDGDRVALTFLIGDVATVLAEAEARVDAWFLDGFSPARNPDMWSPKVFTEIARLSAPGAALASFTVAETVCRGLHAAGFTLENRPGFDRKRGADRNKEMLAGKFTGSLLASRIPPWYRPPPPISRGGTTAIIGAGIAGCAVAGALGRRGMPAIVIERHTGIAEEASGNPTALIAPRDERGESAAALFHDRAYRMILASIDAADLDWQARGALRISRGGEILSRLWPGAATPLNAREASERAGITLDASATWFPDAGLINPARLAGHFARAAETRFGQMVSTLNHDDRVWHVLDEAGGSITEAETVVVTAARGSIGFAPLSWLPSRVILGQLSLVPETRMSRGLRMALIWGGYMTPALAGAHVLGATHERVGFDPSAWPQPVTAGAHERNARESPPAVRRLFSMTRPGDWSGRAAARCAMPDHLPAAGPVAIAEEFLVGFDRVRHGPRGNFPPQAPYHPGLYVMTGLGGRGITTAALAAELMVSQMLDEPWPIERRVALALAPSRFLVRHLRRPTNVEAESAGVEGM